MDRKLFIIGDIHGRYQELKKLLTEIESGVRVIIVGDLINRGPDSRKVIDLIRTEKIECVLGNHELMFIETKYLVKSILVVENSKMGFEEKLLEKDALVFSLKLTDWFRNGGDVLFEEYNGNYKKMLKDIKFLKKLPLYIETNVFNEEGKEALVSHTCIIPRLNEIKNIKLLDKEVSSTVWSRFKAHQIYNNKTNYFNIFGHTPTDVFNDIYQSSGNPYISKSQRIANVDTGACYDREKRGFLSGIYFPSLEIKKIKSNFK